MGNWEGEEFIRPVILGRIGHSDPDTDSLLSTQIQVRIRTKKNRAEEGGARKTCRCGRGRAGRTFGGFDVECTDKYVEPVQYPIICSV
jgi:hypothetical protein